MEKAKVIKKTISLEYRCPEKNKFVVEKIKWPSIYKGQHFSDWEYEYIELVCKLCGKQHQYEI